MKKKKMIINLLTIVLLVAFTGGLYMYFNKSMEPVNVVVFTGNLEKNVEIMAGDVKLEEIPKRSLKSNMLTELDKAVGKFTSTEVFGNNYTYVEQVVELDAIDPLKDVDLSLYRKISIPLNFLTGNGGEFKTGDLVDLFYVSDGTTESETSQSQSFVFAKRFISNVMVYKVLNENGMQYEDRTDISLSTYSEDENLADGDTVPVASEDKIGQIIVLMTPEQAEEFYAREYSGVIRVAGTFGDNTDYETEGFVIGTYSQIFTGAVEVETKTETESSSEGKAPTSGFFNPQIGTEQAPGFGLVEEVENPNGN